MTWHAHVRQLHSKERGRSGATQQDLATASMLLTRGAGRDALKALNRRPRTPKATRDYENLVRQECRLARGRDSVHEGWCVVGVFILDLIPASWRTTKGGPTLQARRAAWQVEPAAASHDVDNIIKAALDGANGVWYRGDAKVLPVPWRGWTAEPKRAGLHLMLWPAATPAESLQIVAGEASPWAAAARKLGRPPEDWPAP